MKNFVTYTINRWYHYEKHLDYFLPICCCRNENMQFWHFWSCKVRASLGLLGHGIEGQMTRSTEFNDRNIWNFFQTFLSIPCWKWGKTRFKHSKTFLKKWFWELWEAGFWWFERWISPRVPLFSRNEAGSEKNKIQISKNVAVNAILSALRMIQTIGVTGKNTWNFFLESPYVEIYFSGLTKSLLQRCFSMFKSYFAHFQPSFWQPRFIFFFKIFRPHRSLNETYQSSHLNCH